MKMADVLAVARWSQQTFAEDAPQTRVDMALVRHQLNPAEQRTLEAIAQYHGHKDAELTVGELRSFAQDIIDAAGPDGVLTAREYARHLGWADGTKSADDAAMVLSFAARLRGLQITPPAEDVRDLETGIRIDLERAKAMLGEVFKIPASEGISRSQYARLDANMTAYHEAMTALEPRVDALLASDAPQANKRDVLYRYDNLIRVLAGYATGSENLYFNPLLYVVDAPGARQLGEELSAWTRDIYSLRKVEHLEKAELDRARSGLLEQGERINSAIRELESEELAAAAPRRWAELARQTRDIVLRQFGSRAVIYWPLEDTRPFAIAVLDLLFGDHNYKLTPIFTAAELGRLRSP